LKKLETKVGFGFHMVCFPFPHVSHILVFRLHDKPQSTNTTMPIFNPVTLAQRKLPVKRTNWWKRSRSLASRGWKELQTIHAWPGR
jgi:hypothetical protein